MAGLVLIGAGALYRSNTNPHDWARDEAEERNRRRAAGLPIVYGVNYGESTRRVRCQPRPNAVFRRSSAPPLWLTV